MDEISYYRDRLYIPPQKELKQQILIEAIDIPIASHSDYIKMYATLCKSFWWNGMKQDILSYGTCCLSC